MKKPDMACYKCIYWGTEYKEKTGDEDYCTCSILKSDLSDDFFEVILVNGNGKIKEIETDRDFFCFFFDDGFKG